MPKKLAVFADGTGNSASKSLKTNVWRLYQALDLAQDDQIAVFDDGVGTSSFKPLKVLGLALGVGVKRNIIDLYKFLCRNYADGDRIYAFGFSRGAFTVRALTGLIHHEGLVSFKSEEELDRNAVAAYRAYRKAAFPSRLPWVKWGRIVRDMLVRRWNLATGSRTYLEIKNETHKQDRDRIDIHFLGVWDTVAAYGLPIDELTRAVDQWVWPMMFRDKSLLPNVIHARHALSLDDERRTFFPILWDEEAEQRLQKHDDSNIPKDRLLQVWFAGVHANVGGGYPDDRLANISLCWMIEEAAKQDLRFKEWAVASYLAIASPTGRLYDSRSGLGAFYRYQPRDAGRLMGADTTPIVHNSVIIRMAEGGDGYAPISLPEEVKVLPFYGALIPFEGLLPKGLVAPPIPEDKLPVPASEKRDLGMEQEKLTAAIEKLTADAGMLERAAKVNLMLDTIWWRRVTYFVTLLLALFVAAYPFMASHLRFGFALMSDQIGNGYARSIVGFVRGFLPGFAEPWLAAVVRYPTVATIVALFLILSLLLSGFLQRRIRDRARAAWSVEARKDGHSLDLHRIRGQRRAAAAGALLFALASLGAWLLGSRRGLLLILIIPLFAAVVLFVWRTFRRDAQTNDTPGALLGVARFFRKFHAAKKAYSWIAEIIFPAAFLFVFLLAIIFILNRIAFDGLAAVGHFCQSTFNSGEPLVETLRSNVNFTTQAMCQPTGVVLEEGGRYRIRIEIKEHWFDKDIPTDVRGYASDTLSQTLATPLKRWWGETWFQPIARLGVLGNDEYVLNPVAPLKRVSFEPCNTPVQPSISALHDISSPITAEVLEQRLACERKEHIRPSSILVSELTARSTGELFIYVNDAVLMLPGLINVFYQNNSGTAAISVERVEAQ
jgi:uncharacterized protein (DUF2235 family)